MTVHSTLQSVSSGLPIGQPPYLYLLVRECLRGCSEERLHVIYLGHVRLHRHCLAAIALDLVHDLHIQ